MLHGLDLFSGIGGNSIGLRDYVKTVAYCEADRHAQSVLLSRMADGSIPRAPIWDDITSLSGSMLPSIDIIIGGFPCQDISIAGNGAGLVGKRSGLFFQIVRLAKEIKPKFLFLENVPAIRTRGLDRVIEELTKAGYDCRWGMLSAADVGAHHIRERWFLLANSKGSDGRGNSRELPKESSAVERSEDEHKNSPELFSYASANTKVLANSDCEHVQSKSESVGQAQSKARKQKWRDVPNDCRSNRARWEIEPDVGRVVDGVSFRVDRIKRLGNAVVPVQAKEAFERLVGFRK